MKLTLLVAVRNEADKIKNFLGWHSSCFDDVVVVHDGECTDDTLVKALEFQNVRVFERPGFLNPFPHREWALRYVITEGWVAVFDPDEELCMDLLNDLRTIINGAEEKGQDGIALKQMIYCDGVQLETHYPWRIFKHSDRVHYPSHPHAGIEGLTSGLVLEDKYSFDHWWRAEDLPSKIRRRSAILKNILRYETDLMRRAAFTQGLVVPDTWLKAMAERGVTLTVSGDPLMQIKGIKSSIADRLKDDIGIETLDELIKADALYVSKVLEVSDERVRRWQKAASDYVHSQSVPQ